MSLGHNSALIKKAITGIKTQIIPLLPQPFFYKKDFAANSPNESGDEEHAEIESEHQEQGKDRHHFDVYYLETTVDKA